MKKYSKFFAILLAVAMILPGVAQTAQAADVDNVVRLGGDSRIETSIEVSKVAYPTGAKEVVLAGWNGEPDALTGTILANAKDAPVLFTHPTVMKSELVEELDRLNAEKVYVLGGESVVSKGIVTALEAKDLEVVRIAGGNRSETAVKAAQESGKATTHVFLANGFGNLADALAAGPASATESMPILLTEKDRVPASTLAAMKALGVTHVTILGEVGAVSEAVETELSDYTVDRVGGTNRERTAVAIADKYFADYTKALVANGYGSPDALVGGYLGAKIDAPILLTQATRINPASIEALTKASKAWILGETDVVSEVVENEVIAAVEGKVEEELMVESVSAIGAKKLEVTFNKSTETAEITVKKGSVAVNVDKVELAEDGKSAVVTTVTNLTKGDYTVRVGESEVTITVEDPKVAKINILSETAPRLPSGSDQKALVSYEVLNQYDEKMTNQNITWTISTGKAVANEDKVKGTFEIESADGNTFIPGSKVYITGVHGTTATVVNAEVVIGLESKVAEVEFKGVYNTTKSNLEDLPAGFVTNKYVLLFEAKDQYGNKVDTTASELTMLSNNPLFIAQPTTLGTDVTLDDVVYKALELEPGTQVTKGGIATIQIVSNNTGKIASYTINADALPALKDFSISAPDKVIAGNDSKVEIPFEAVDQYGNAVTKFDDLNGKVTLSPAALKFEKQQDGSAKLFYTPSSNTGTTDTIATLTSLVPTNGSYSNIQLTIKPDAKPEAVIGLSKDKSTSIAAGNNVKFKAEDLLLQDQYGRILTKAQVNAWIDETDNAIVIKSDGAAGVITTAATGTDGFVYVTAASGEFTVAATAAAGANTEKLVISLSTGKATPDSDSVIDASAKSVTFTRVIQSQYVSYEVEDLPTMYNNATQDTATDGKYDVVPKVYGVTEAGNKVLLPAAKYSITTNGKLDTTTTAGTIKDNKSEVVGEDYLAADFKDVNGNAKDITVKVTIMVNDESGAAAATIEKDLVVSNATPVAKTVTLTDAVVNGAAFVDKEALNNDEPSGVATATNLALNGFVKEIKDQYGAKITPTADITISNLEKVEASSFAVTKNGADDVSITGATEGDKFTATFKYAGGKTVSINFVVSDI